MLINYHLKDARHGERGWGIGAVEKFGDPENATCVLQILFAKHVTIKLFLSQTLSFTDTSTHLDLSRCECVYETRVTSTLSVPVRPGTAAWSTPALQLD